MSDTHIDPEEPLSIEVKKYLKTAQGRRVSLKDIRLHLKIQIGSPGDANLRVMMSSTLLKQKIVVPSGHNDGIYKVVKQVKPVRVFGLDRKTRPPFPLNFPRDYETGMEMGFAESLIIREGDLITTGGGKSRGKTTFCMNLAAMNIDSHPVLMGNEYTVEVDEKNVPAPRFLERCLRMAEWVNWTDEEGKDKFTLWPIDEDYAMYVEPGKLNIIDWIDIDGGAAYEIGSVLKGIKKSVGSGVVVVALQKSEFSADPRGGQYVRDYSDLELTLDGFGKNPDDVLLTIRGAKERREGTPPIVGKTYAYTIWAGGTQVRNFREVKKCNRCFGSGKSRDKECDNCWGKGYQDV